MSMTDATTEIDASPAARIETHPVRLAGRSEYRLSFNQREMWVLCQLHGGSALHNMAVAVAIEGALDPDVFDAALQAVVDRHEALRTAFPEIEGQPVQQVAAVDARACRHDVTALPAPEQERFVRDRATVLARTPFALDRAPLFRAELIRLADDRWAFAFAFHNLVLDGFHLPQLLEEIARTCVQFQRGDRQGPAPLALQFGDFAEWEHQRFAAGQLAPHEGHWRDALRPPLPAMTATADWRGPTARTFATASVTRRLSPELSARVRRLARHWKSTTFRAATAAFAVVWWRLTGERDVLVATPFSLRPNEMSEAVGFFGNTLPLRSTVDPAAPFDRLVAAVTAAVRDAVRHREFPLTELFRTLDQPRDPNRPLMPVCVAQVKPIEIVAGGLRLTAGEILSGGTAFDFSLLVGEDARGIELQLAYASELFDEATAATLLSALETVLAHAVEHPDATTAALRVLGPDERTRVTAWGAGDAPTPPAGPTLLDELAAAVARTPEAPAVVAGGETWTYREIERAWTRVAAALAGSGAGREARVGILGTRSPGMMAAAIGILRAGAAFVPLDASHPDARLDAIADAASLTAIITDRQTRGRAQRLTGTSPSRPVLCWDELIAGPGDADAPPVRSGDRDLAYIYFTSGSTGAPKGAMVEHRGLRNHLRAKIGVFELDATSVVVQNSSYGFDVIVWQWLAPLLVGGRVLVYDEATAEDPATLLAAMERDGATLLETVPSFLEALIEAAETQPRRRLPALRWLLSQAEMLPPPVARRWIARFPSARLVNGYGPTECSDDTMHGVVERPAVSVVAARVDIGHPIPGSTVFVVDERLEPLPPGFVGEIVIGGVPVGRGYLGNPAQTARAFVPDPHAADGGARLYRTGDRGRWRSDGRLECLGRRDDQIKLHGYRVELGDVEAALAELPELSQVAAAVRTDERGQPRLVAYYVAAEAADAAAVRRHLAARLPAFMVPSALVRLNALPRTLTGKLDRLALPAPPANAAVETVAPASPLEAELAAVWGEVLRLPAVGRDDNFFDLGGDSIQCIRVVSRLNQRGFRLSPRAVFAHQTVAELAQVIEQTAAPTAAPAPVATADAHEGPRQPAPADAEDVYPLAPIQEGMLFHAMLEPGSSLYYEQVHFALDGPLDIAALQRAWDRVVQHHPVLRTVIRWEGRAEPVQVVRPHRAASIAVVDLSDRDPAAQETAIAGAASHDWTERFALDRGPLVRLALFALGEGRYRFVWTFHHILLDGWSGTSLLRDLAAAYADCASGREATLGPVPRYGDFLAWLRRQDRTAARAFWRRHLADFAAPTPLPRDRPAGGSRQRLGAGVELTIAPGQARAIEQRARGERVTMSAFVRTAWAVVLARTSGVDDVLFGATVSGRPTELEGVEQMVGPFINAVPVRVRVARTATIGHLLKGIQALSVDAAAFEYLPLTDVQAASAVPADTPLFDSLVAYENFPVEERPTSIGDARLTVLHSRELTHYDLTLYAVPSSEGLLLRLAYAPDRFDEATARRLLAAVATTLTAGASDPQACVWDLPLLSPDDAQRLAAWGDGGPGVTFADIGRELASVAERRQASIALIAGADQWTYGRLQAGADAMRAALGALGAGREHRIGVLGTRSPGMVATVIATLQAGAAFVPLEAGHPDARLQAIAAAAGLTAIAVDRNAVRRAQRLVADLPAPAPVVVCWDDVIARGNAGGQEPIAPALPADLAYVFHTSGSTGTPKGVMVERASMWNHLQAKRETLALDASSVVAQTAAYGFDIVVWQWLAALLAGGRVVIYDDAIAEDPSLLLARLAADRVTVVETVPSFLETLIEVAERPDRPALPDLQWMVSNAEALPAAVAARWKACCPTTRLLNTYGATECGDDTTHYEVPDRVVSDERVSVGCPIPGVTVTVVDDRMRRVLPGITGEVLLGGVAVGRGYLGDPAATAAAFLPDPWSDRPGARLYRTGDRGRWRADGRLECVGRTDHQIKIRGHRVELAEVEAALAAVPGLGAIAAAVRADAAGRARLIGYYVAPAAYDPAALRRELGSRVPGYMVPDAFVRLDTLPRTRTGKLDRAALPSPPPAAPADPESDGGPTTPLEATIAAVWQQILGVDRVGRDDNFFDLGGHSLSAIRIVAALKDRLGRRVPIRQLLAGPTVAELAAAIGGDTPEAAPAPAPIAPRAWSPLSAAQRSQWIAQQMSAGEEWYSPRVLQLDGALDRVALSAALQDLVARHDALRTTFTERDGDVVQEVAERYELPWREDDLSAMAAEPQAARVRAILEEESRRPFVLRQLPLLEVRLVRLAAERHLLIFRMPHIVTDGWSEGILATDLAELYNAHRAGRAPALPALALRHVDVCADEAERLRTATLQAQKAYWLEQFSGDVPSLQLPTQPTGGGGHRTAYATGAVDPRAIEALRQLAAAHGVTLFVAMLGVFEVLLARVSRQSDFVVATPIAGRGRPELERVAGLFANLLPLRSSLAGNPTFVDVLTRISRTTLAGLANQDYPYHHWIEERRRTSPGSSRLFSAFFVMHEEAFHPLFDGLSTRWFSAEAFGASLFSRSFPWYPQSVGFYANDAGDGWRVTMLGDSSAFADSFLREMLAHWLAIADQVTADPQRRVAEVELPGTSADGLSYATVALDGDEVEQLFA